MKCPFCNRKIIFKEDTYHYTESGLDDVYLITDVYKCKCGEIIADIPKIYRLHELIAKKIVKKGSMLTGKEIKFLRKQLHFKATELAFILGVNKVTVSRWENEETEIGVANDKLIRMIYMQICQEKCKKVFKIVDDIESISRTVKREKIVIPQKDIKEANICM